MRRSRGLTRSERWDIGLMTALLVVMSLCAAAIWKTDSLPRLYAFAFNIDRSGSANAAEASATAELNALPLSNQVPAPTSNVAVVEPITPTPAIVAPKVVKPAVTYKTFNGEKYRYLKTIKMRVTAYAPDPRCCWPYPGTTTASGLSVRTNSGKLVAADTKVLPFKSLVSVPGYHGGETVPVLDRGDAIKGNRLDVLMPTFAQAQNWGSRMIDVKVYVPVDE